VAVRGDFELLLRNVYDLSFLSSLLLLYPCIFFLILSSICFLLSTRISPSSGFLPFIHYTLAGSGTSRSLKSLLSFLLPSRTLYLSDYNSE